MPDFVGILLDRTVTGKLPHAGDVENRLLIPHRRMTELTRGFPVSVSVGVEVRQEKILVTPVEQRLEHPVKQSRFFLAKSVRAQGVQRAFNPRTTMVPIPGMVAAVTQRGYFFGRFSEDENVFLAHFFPDLDICTV